MTNVQSSGAFRWTQEPWGAALRCGPVEMFADHLFTTRQLELRRGGTHAPEAWSLLAHAVNVSSDALIRLHQVHGVTAVRHNRGDRLTAASASPTGDIVVTNDPAVAIAVQVADCLPVLIADPRTGAVAAAHAGWRGTAAGVARETVMALCTSFGARAADLIAAIGPSIGPCCYEVGEELVDAFRAAGFGPEHLTRWFVREGHAGRLRLNLWAANRDQLLDAGLLEPNIHFAALCTASHADLFFSFRRDGPAAGRMAGIIRARGSSASARDNADGTRTRRLVT